MPRTQEAEKGGSLEFKANLVYSTNFRTALSGKIKKSNTRKQTNKQAKVRVGNIYLQRGFLKCQYASKLRAKQGPNAFNVSTQDRRAGSQLQDSLVYLRRSSITQKN